MTDLKEKWNSTDDEYHAYPALGSGDVKKLAIGISDFLRYQNFTATPATEFGSLCHTLLFEPDTFEDKYLVLDLMENGKYPVRSKKMKEECAPKELITRKHYDDAIETLSVLPTLPGLRRAEKEVAVKVMCNDIWLKAKFDAVNFEKHIIFDYKTIATGNLHTLARGWGLAELGWDMQAYHYKLVYHLHTGVPFEEISFVFLVSEKSTYEPMVLQLDGDCDQNAEEKHLLSLANYEKFLNYYGFTQSTVDFTKTKATDFLKYGLTKYTVTPSGFDEASRKRFDKANGALKHG